MTKFRNHPRTEGALILLIAALAAALMAPPAFAQVGRASVTIENEAGETVEGATVMATSEDEKVTLERTSNKKGKVNFAFRDASQTYAIRVTAQGYEPFIAEIEPDSAKLTYQTYVLKPAGSSPAMTQPTASPPKAPASADPTADATTDATVEDAVLSPAQASFNAGVDALKAGELADAKTAFSHALTLDPELQLAYSALAGIALEEKKWADAEGYARQTLAAEPTNARALQLLYEAQSGAGDDAAAEKTLAEIEQMLSGADAAGMLYNQGAEAFKLGDEARARERLEKALAKAPELYQASRLLAVLALTSGDFDAALEYADHSLARQPADVMVLRVRWDAYRGLGRDAEAQAALADLQQADPSAGATSLYDKAEQAFNAGDTADALALLEQVVAIDSDHASAHYLLGLSHINMDDKAAARAALERFLALAPDDPRAGDVRNMLQYL